MDAQGWAVLATVLYVTGLAALSGLRTWQHRRVTGSSGFNGSARRDGWARASGLLFAAAVLAGTAALVLAATGTVQTLILRGLMQPLAAAGLVVAAAGLVLAWVAQSSMGTSWRIGVDPGETTELVTTGVFARARNPIFTAMVAAQAGTVLMTPSWLSLLALATLVAAIELQVRRVEEPYLRKTHGAGYLDYSTRVGRFVPSIGRHHTAAARLGGH